MKLHAPNKQGLIMTSRQESGTLAAATASVVIVLVDHAMGAWKIERGNSPQRLRLHGEDQLDITSVETLDSAYDDLQQRLHSQSLNITRCYCVTDEWGKSMYPWPWEAKMAGEQTSTVWETAEWQHLASECRISSSPWNVPSPQWSTRILPWLQSSHGLKWIPTVNQPYRTLVEAGQTEEFTRLEDGHVFAEVTGTPGEKDWMKVTSFDRLPTYEHPEKHSGYIQRVKAELANTAEKLVHEAVEKDYIYSGVAEAFALSKALCQRDMRSAGDKKSGAVVCYTTINMDWGSEEESEFTGGISISGTAMKANIFLKMAYSGAAGTGNNIPKHYVARTSSILTELTNRLLSVNLGIPSVRIDSFADDYVELLDSLNRSGYAHHAKRLNDCLLGYFSKENWGVVCSDVYYQKLEPAFANAGFSVEEYAKLFEQGSATHKKGFAIFVPLLAGEFGFNLYPGEVKLIDTEQQEWIHRLAREAHLHKLNNFVLRDVYLKSMDGVVFRIDVAEMLDERYLISRV